MRMNTETHLDHSRHCKMSLGMFDVAVFKPGSFSPQFIQSVDPGFRNSVSCIPMQYTHIHYFIWSIAVCNHEIQLDFEGDPRVCLDRESDPESCQAAARFRGAERRVRHGQGSSGVEGGLIGAPAPRWEADASHSRELENMMTGSGPWSWQGSTPIAFLRGGVLNVRPHMTCGLRDRGGGLMPTRF